MKDRQKEKGGWIEEGKRETLMEKKKKKKEKEFQGTEHLTQKDQAYSGTRSEKFDTAAIFPFA